MTSRLLITMLLALGIMMSGAGATLAVSGLADDQGSAAQVQYPDRDGGEGGTGGETGGGGNGDEVQVLGEQESSGDTQPAAQTAAGDDTGSLAFTGFAALPLLALGLGLLSTGIVMRRRARPDQDA